MIFERKKKNMSLKLEDQKMHIEIHKHISLEPLFLFKPKG